MTSISFHLAQLRYAYSQLHAAKVYNQEQFAKGLIAPTIRALEEFLGALSAHHVLVPKDATPAMVQAATAVDWEAEGDWEAVIHNIWHAMTKASLAPVTDKIQPLDLKPTDEMINAACEAIAITSSRQDGVTLTKAGFLHGAEARPAEHALMKEYVRDGLAAALAVATPTPVSHVMVTEVGDLRVQRASLIAAGIDPNLDHIPEVLMPKAIGSWRPISEADRTITDVQDFAEVGIQLRTSDRYWVRDEDGRVYEASWSEGRYGRDYWWDWDAESPVDPVEFMPHPLDPRFAALASEGSEG